MRFEGLHRQAPCRSEAASGLSEVGGVVASTRALAMSWLTRSRLIGLPAQTSSSSPGTSIGDAAGLIVIT